MGLFDNRERMWFGTEQRMGWIETPQTGADVSSAGMLAESTLLGGGAHVRNSWDSHKTYTFSWGDSTTLDMVSLLQGYRNGSYGRGLLYFHDPMYYGTNLLPKRWADPSMAVNFEAEPIIPENWPTSVPVNSSDNNYPVTAARYTLPANYSSQTDSAEHFIPIPPGMTLMLGGVYSGPGQVYVRTPAGVTVLPSMGLSDSNVVNVAILGQPWARLGVRNTSASASQITITGMTARLSEVAISGGGTYVNTFTNPSFEAAGPTVEVRRNLMPNPLPANATDFNVSGTPTILPEGGLNNQSVTAQTAYIFSAPTAGGATAGRVYAFRAQVKGDAGTAVSSILPRPHKRVGNAYYTPDSGIVSYPSNGEWQDVAFFWTATENVAPADMFEFSLISNGTAPIGFNMAIRNMLIEDVGTVKPATVPPFFSAGNSGDADLTAAFVGAANASPTALTGVSVPGVTTVRAFAIRSTRWARSGMYSLRIIPTSATTQAAITVTAPANASHIVTSWLPAPLSGNQGSLGGTLRRTNPTYAVDQRPNVAGVYTHRIYTEAATGNLEFWGGRAGEGDIWIDMLTIVAGVYPGNQFDGYTEGAYWNGTPNASTSTYAQPLQTELAAGPWRSGEGHSGVAFVGNPTVINYNGVNGGQLGLSCVLREVGAWA